MKYGIIDVGSNSVRLLVCDEKTTYLKTNKITRLSENMGDELILKSEMVARTVEAVSFFVNMAIDNKVDIIKIFATAAVRLAKNQDYFLEQVKLKTGFDVDVVSGELEASLGVNGALNGKDGAVIDIGGASTELAILKNGSIVYKKSINIGAVSLYSRFNENLDKISDEIKKQICQFKFDNSNHLYGIGGTITSLASIDLKLEPYDSSKIHGYCLTYDKVEKIIKNLSRMSLCEREKIVGLQKERAVSITSGAFILYEIMKNFQISTITVSECDNLEGYFNYIRGKNAK